MFDVFLHLCREDYVGLDNGTLTSKTVHETCKHISKLCMDHRPRPGNRIIQIQDTADELYKKFIGVVTGLPEDATGWPLSIWNTYFSALVVPL